MNSAQNESFIYCTPFLDEVERIKRATNIGMREPSYKGGRKLDDFNDLLMDGENIVVTHSTFANANADTLEFLRQGNYTLILDEVLDILNNYNDVVGDSLNKADIKLLINEGFIEVDDYGKVAWIKESYPTSKYSNVERLARNGNLFYLDDTMLVWQFPAEIFSTFKEVYILTYLFRGSYLKPYLEYHEIGYEMKGIDNSGEKYVLTEYKSDKEDRAKLKELITIYTDPKLEGEYKSFKLSSTWFKKRREKKRKQSNEDIQKLKNSIYNYFRNKAKAKACQIMWTCPKDSRKQLEGKGYKEIRRITAIELNGLSEKEIRRLKNKNSCYVTLNARATNDFGERSVLAYINNFFAQPYMKRYFENKNAKDGTNISVDEDYLALSCMIQWIWRSRIRNGKSIIIYIPSDRMRNFFLKWLDGIM